MKNILKSVASAMVATALMTTVQTYVSKKVSDYMDKKDGKRHA